MTPAVYNPVVNFAFLFPRFKLLSGAERLILKLTEALLHQGHSVSICCHRFDESCRPLLPSSANLVITGAKLDYFANRYWNAAFDYWKAGKLVEAIPGEPDAICCFGPALTALPRAQEKFRVPVLYFCYEPPRYLYTDQEVILRRLGAATLLGPPLLAWYRRRDQKLVSRADAVLSNSFFGKEQIHTIYGRDAQVITHGLDPYRAGTRRDALRQLWGVGTNDIAAITVNYLHPRKRIDLFIKTIGAAHHANPAVKGIVVGDGPERERLTLIGGPDVVFTGFVPESDLFEYYQAADLYLHTARMETFGLSVIEACGNGLPVVSVREGGPTETLVDGETGLLCDPDPHALSNAVLSLLDPQKRCEMGKRASERVRKEYTWEKGAGDFIAAVESCRKK
ncbi:MAG TPA: glycosyltransferase family 4 protein [Acidobacteriota bacterium]|nr:glycosyltransferase family 4 protein [Acidobacteriota bacterium]